MHSHQDTFWANVLHVGEEPLVKCFVRLGEAESATKMCGDEVWNVIFAKDVDIENIELERSDDGIGASGIRVIANKKPC